MALFRPFPGTVDDGQHINAALVLFDPVRHHVGRIGYHQFARTVDPPDSAGIGMVCQLAGPFPDEAGNPEGGAWVILRYVVLQVLKIETCPTGPSDPHLSGVPSS